jgi:hypothetical protein
VTRLVAAAVLAVAALVAAAPAGAGEPLLEVRLEPPAFGVEDAVRLVVKVHDPATDVAMPSLGELRNLQVVAGPSRGHEFSFVNGVSTTTISFSYVLRAEGEGPASLGPVTVAVGESELRSDPLEVEVAPGSLAPTRRGRRPSTFPTDPFADMFGRRAPPRQARIELRHLVSTRSVVRGQPVMATVVLDTTAAVDDFGWIEAPAYPGWWAQRVEPPEQITPETVEMDGIRYSRFTIARHALVPLRTGELVLPEVSARIGTRSRAFLDPGQVVERRTSELRIAVTERPPAPPGFAGAVGALRYTAAIEPETISFGESAVLTVKLAGSGNLPLVEAPPVWPECEGCESFPPEEDSRVSVDEAGIHGSRTWRLTVVPRQWGQLELGPAELAVFDPSGGGYRRHTLGPLTLNVTPPPPTPTPEVTPPPTSGAETDEPTAPGDAADSGSVPLWLWLTGSVVLGAVLGGLLVRWTGRRRRVEIPPRLPDQSPADRARELQLTLERWWVERRAKGERRGLKPTMDDLRRDLEAVRFAPARADHSETIVELEQRLRALMRRA